LKEFHESGYTVSDGILQRLAAPFMSSYSSKHANVPDHLDMLSMTSEMRYLETIVKNMNDRLFMRKWLEDDQERYRMMYSTLVFLACMAINPSIPSVQAFKNSDSLGTNLNSLSESDSSKIKSGFGSRTKQQIIHSWQKIHEKKTESFWVNGQVKELDLIRDCCGLWCMSHPLKRQLGKMEVTSGEQGDAISAYDIEHIVSNSYDIPSQASTDWSNGWNQPWNGVLLDSSINRKKGNTMLFLVGDDVVSSIRKKKELQQWWMRKNRIRWYQSAFRWFRS
jgi:hypothetical protein